MEAQFLYNPPDKGLRCHAPTLVQTAAGARTLIGSGIRVYNCSPTSDLDCFAKVSYEYALSL